MAIHKKTVNLSNPISLPTGHSATDLVKLANQFRSSIWIEKDNIRASAKTLLGLLSAGIVGCKGITLIAEGEDAEEAIEKIIEFLQSGAFYKK